MNNNYYCSLIKTNHPSELFKKLRMYRKENKINSFGMEITIEKITDGDGDNMYETQPPSNLEKNLV